MAKLLKNPSSVKFLEFIEYTQLKEVGGKGQIRWIGGIRDGTVWRNNLRGGSVYDTPILKLSS